MSGSRNNAFVQLIKDGTGLDGASEIQAVTEIQAISAGNFVKERITGRRGPSQNGASRPPPR